MPSQDTAVLRRGTALPLLVTSFPIRAFLALSEDDRLIRPEADLPRFEPALLSVLRREGIVRDGDPGRVELSPTDQERLLRRLHGLRSLDLALPSTQSGRPVLLGW